MNEWRGIVFTGKREEGREGHGEEVEVGARRSDTRRRIGRRKRRRQGGCRLVAPQSVPGHVTET